jgi:hypothetical protein
LELEFHTFSLYKVILKKPESDDAIWSSDKLKVNQNNSVSITLPTAFLQNQIYQFELSGISANGTSEFVSSYTYKILRK